MPIWSHFFFISVVIQPNLQRAISPIIRSEVAKATDPTFFDPTVSLGKGLDMNYTPNVVRKVWVPSYGLKMFKEFLC